MRLRNQRPVRRGATIAEAALVSLVFLMLLLGMLDLGLGVMRFNTISQAARHTARQATVHGGLAPTSWQGGIWGPATIDSAATDTTVPAVNYARTMLIGCDINNSRVKVEWPDGGNAVQQNVKVTVTTPYKPLLTFFLPNSTITLTATTTMPIAH
jgi:hypothetical protein